MTPIAEKVINAFSSIESKDLRVTRLLIPQQKFDLMEKEFTQQHGYSMFDHVSHDPQHGDGFTLWGAQVEFSNRFEAVADGWVARYADTHEEIIDLRDPIATAPVIGRINYVKYFNIIVRRPRGDSIYLDKCSPEERIALETLREYITEAEYRRYLRDKFLIVRAASGKIYQIYRNQWHTKVWLNGQLIEEICVRLNSSIPPTDNVLAFAFMILINEDEFRKAGNVYNLQKKIA